LLELLASDLINPVGVERFEESALDGLDSFDDLRDELDPAVGYGEELVLKPIQVVV
jgi:hypothetical protein